MAVGSEALPPGTLSLEGVRRYIEELRAIDLRTVSIDDLKRHLSVLMTGAGHAVPSVNPDQDVYRARLFTGLGKPTQLRELLYPPPSCVKFDQRVNRAGTTMFYCCAIPECTYFEIGG